MLVALMAGPAVSVANAAPAEPATTGTATTGTATAPAPAAVRPPGPPRHFTVGQGPGGGARGIGITASWQPADAHGGSALRYRVRVRNDIGDVSTQTTTATSVNLFSDYCLAPVTVSVRAQSTDPRTGRTLLGPEVSGRYGKRDLCEINMSITAKPGPDRGTVEVVQHREAPVDPFVTGPCELLFDGVARWSGWCGKADDQTVTVAGLTPGRPYDVVLRTTTPRHRVLQSNHVRVDAS